VARGFGACPPVAVIKAAVEVDARPERVASAGPAGEDEAMKPPGAAHLLAGFMAAAGTAHLLFPRAYEQLIPSGLGSPRPWVYGSGVAELACAAALATTAARRPAAWATAALFVGVFPGNVTMAVQSSDRDRAYRAVTYARLPLQVPLVWWAVAVARAERGNGRTASRLPQAAPSS